MQRNKKSKKSKNLQWMKRTQNENDKKNATIALNKNCTDSKRCKNGKNKVETMQKMQKGKKCKECNLSRNEKNAKKNQSSQKMEGFR